MSGSFADCFPSRRRPLAICLCLLAFLFAVEAKTAWYGPKVGPGSDVQAAKALPAVTPKVVQHGVPAPDPVHPQIAFAALSAVSAGSPSAAHLFPRQELLRSHLPHFTATFLSPQLFFRPPPVL